MLRVEMPQDDRIDLLPYTRECLTGMMHDQPRKVLENMHERMFRMVFDGTRNGDIPSVSTAYKAKLFNIITNELNARRMLTSMANGSE